MRKARGPRARWALAGALLMAIASTSNALGMAPSTRLAVTTGNGHRPALTLGANLDRAPVGRYLGLARMRAIEAVAARARLAAAMHRRMLVQHHRDAPPNHLWIP